MRLPFLQMLFLFTILPGMRAQDYTFVINDGAVMITQYTGPGGSVVIPDSIGGLPVTGIGDYAFENRTSLAYVILGNRVTSIGEGAFCFCTNLNSVTTPDTLTSIGAAAFSFCTSLT
ncbi:MAG TPA: leucine-rich repeat domain-containing protein, partial [Candidatus Paceibacterota bacterium]|nr:leucine-rich repeat domain-containing protein [Candidatus Paceibacterota bacterium]